MRRVVLYFAVALAGLLVGGSSGYWAADVGRAAGTARIATGYGTVCSGRGGAGHPCWHFNEAEGSMAALDLHTNQPAQDVNRPVWWWQWGTSWYDLIGPGGGGVRFEVLPEWANCTGVIVKLTNGLSGKFHYLHIDPVPDIDNSDWQEYVRFPSQIIGRRYLGVTKAGEKSTCAWLGPHLHQSGDVALHTDIYRNFPPIQACGTGSYCWQTYAFYVLLP